MSATQRGRKTRTTVAVCRAGAAAAMTGKLFRPPRPNRVSHGCGQSIASPDDQVHRCGSLCDARSGLERGWRCLLLERCPGRCGDGCSAVRIAGLKSWSASAATEDGATAAVNAAHRRAAKRSTRPASAIRARARAASRMPGGRGGIANVSANGWRSHRHRRYRRYCRHRHRHRRQGRHRHQIVTHQWIPSSPVQAVYWGRSWT